MRKVVIASPVATQSGYGHHAREVITNIIEQRGSEWRPRRPAHPAKLNRVWKTRWNRLCRRHP